MKIKALYIILFLVISSNIVFAEDPVYFADPNLKKVVEGTLNKLNPTPTDMLSLTSLYPIGQGIENLTGLEYAVNLTYLNLAFNQIIDIDALSGLTKLEHLELLINQITDINAISGMTNLTYLDLFWNNINDINSLSGLTNLTYLDLCHNQVSDINSLSGLANLTYLDLSVNQISDISALSELTNLSFLDLRHYNTLNAFAHCFYLPLIQANNPGIELYYKPKLEGEGSDWNDDCQVDLLDFAIVADNWYVGYMEKIDEFVDNWLECFDFDCD